MDTVQPTIEPAASTRRGWAVFAILMAVLGVLFVRANYVKEMRVEGYPLVVADPSKLDFGERWEGETFTWSVPIKNTRAGPVCVREVQTSCGCVVVENRQICIEPGRMENLLFRVNASESKGSKSSRGFFSVEVTAYAVDRSEILLRTSLRGVSKQIARVQPHVAVLKGNGIRSERTDVEDIRIEPLIELSDLKILSTIGVEAIIERHADCYLLKSNAVPKSTGTWNGEINLVAVSNAGETVGTIRIPLEGTVRERIVADPETVDFGVIRRGELRRSEVNLRSANGTVLTILKCGAEGPQDMRCHKTDAASIDVEVQPTVKGPGRGNIVVEATDSTNTQCRLRIAVRWHVIGE